jgi:hypothetical protein
MNVPCPRSAPARPPYHTIIIPDPGPAGSRPPALAPPLTHSALYYCFVSPSPAPSARLCRCPASGQDQACRRPAGLPLLTLTAARSGHKHDHPVRFSSAPAAASLCGKAAQRWGDDLMYVTTIARAEKGRDRGTRTHCILVATLGNSLQRTRTTRLLGGTDGVADLLPTIELRHTGPAGGSLRYRDILASWAFPGHRRSIGDRRLPVASTPPTA